MLTSTEQIDFSHPATLGDQSIGPLLNLYLYDIRESKQVQHSGRQIERRRTDDQPHTALVGWAPSWFDVSMMLTAHDRTTLGEHHLLSEALALLLRHRSLREEFLAPELQGYGSLSMLVSLDPHIEIGGLWSALTVPLRPALYLTVALPFEPQTKPATLVWERVLHALNSSPELHDRPAGSIKRVVVAGIVKSASTTDSLSDVEVGLIGTEKTAISNAEGLFFFENLPFGNYVLRLTHEGFRSQTCNVLVDSPTYTFKDVLLTPV